MLSNLHGNGAGAHYKEVLKCTNVQPEEESMESIARTKPEEVLVQIPKTITPEHTRPFPKAPDRQQTPKDMERQKSVILTDTPEKQLWRKNLELAQPNQRKEGKWKRKLERS